MSLISLKMNTKNFIGGTKVKSQKCSRHNKSYVSSESIYDFVNLRYREDIERFRQGNSKG